MWSEAVDDAKAAYRLCAKSTLSDEARFELWRHRKRAIALRRANSVAKVAVKNGARIADVRGYGERMPRASNSTAAGMQQNRRVEIICIR